MAVTPEVLSWMICDGVHVDPATGKLYLLGCFAHLHVRQLPARHPRMFWFLSLTDVPTGKHKLKIDFGPDMSELKTIVERDFEAQNPSQQINLVHDIQNLEFTRPGPHPIVVEIGDETVLVTQLHIHHVGPPPQG